MNGWDSSSLKHMDCVFLCGGYGVLEKAKESKGED